MKSNWPQATESEESFLLTHRQSETETFHLRNALNLNFNLFRLNACRAHR